MKIIDPGVLKNKKKIQDAKKLPKNRKPLCLLLELLLLFLLLEKRDDCQILYILLKRIFSAHLLPQIYFYQKMKNYRKNFATV